jgi:hypothetical protein
MNPAESIKVERFQPELHYASFCKWTRWYEMTPLPLQFLPQSGFVVENVAMGFMYRTDSKMALIENLTANPMVPRVTATQGLDAVVEAIAAEGRSLGFEVLIGYTNVAAVIQRALRHGFTTDDEKFQVVTKVL